MTEEEAFTKKRESENIERSKHNSSRNTSSHNSKVRYDRFDSSSTDRRDEKLVFKYIQRVECAELARHLRESEGRFELLEIVDKSGYTPLHFATYKNSEKTAMILCEFVLGRHKSLSEE